MSTRVCSRSIVLWLLALSLFSLFPDSILAVRLPFDDDFESGNFHAWNDGRVAGFSVTAVAGPAGNRAACGTSLKGRPTDYYLEAVFGDHPRARTAGITGDLFVGFRHTFNTGFDFGSTTAYHKVLLINFEDENDLRRDQVILNVFGAKPEPNRLGQYVIETLHWNPDRSFHSSAAILQNQGSPAVQRPGVWDRISIHIRPNTPGRQDGVLRVWINDALKFNYHGTALRKAGYNPNLVIIGYYAPATDIHGTRCWDHITISGSEPNTATAGHRDRSRIDNKH